MSAPAATSNAVQCLPVFLSHAFLDAALTQQRGGCSDSPLLSQLTSLHSSLPLPLTLFSYLYSVLQHLSLHAATAVCLSPCADATAIAAFSRNLCRGLLQHHRRRPQLSSLLPPLTEAVSHHVLACSHRGAGDELIEQLLVSYVAASVSQSLLPQCSTPGPEQLPAGSSSAATLASSSSPTPQPSSLAVWLELAQTFSDPSTASLSTFSSLSISPLPLTSKLLLAPLSALAAGARLQPDNAHAAALSIAAELAVSASSIITSSAPSCLTAYAHCLQTVMSDWIVHLCTPPHLLPPRSPFPLFSPPSSLLTTLASALPPHCVLRMVLDLIRMLHSPISHFPTAYLPVAAAELPDRPPSPFDAAAVASAASVSQSFHTLLTASSVPLSAVIDALLQEDVSEVDGSLDVAVSFLSSLLSSGLPASYASAFHAYLLHQLTSCSRVAVPLLSALSASLYSARLPLFEPTVSACRRWKEAHDRDAAHAPASQPDSQCQQQQQQRVLELILSMARTHRTISAMFGIVPSNSVVCPPPSPSSAPQLLSSSGYDSWCALVRLYASSPSSCLHAVRLYVNRSAAQQQDWIRFLSSSLNAQLFQRVLQLSGSSAATVSVAAGNSSLLPVQEVGSPSSLQPCGPSFFHSFSSLLSELLQRRFVGCDCIAVCLEQPPAALTSLLSISASVASSRHLSPVHLRSLLSPFLHFSPSSSSSRFPLQSFSPPHLPALFSLVLSYVSSLSSASASCLCLITVIASYSPAYSQRVLACSLAAHLRRHLRLLSSSDPVVSKTAAKAVSLALLLCEEARLEVDAVWDEDMSQLCLQELTQWLVRHTRTAVPAQDVDAAVDLSLPPVLSLLERCVAAENEGGHWLPQLSRRVSAWSPSPLRVGSLSRSRKLMQLLSSLLLSPPSSPLSLLRLAHPQLPAAVEGRLQLLAAHVQRMHSSQSEAADCLCEQRELRFVHAERLADSRDNESMEAGTLELQPADGWAVKEAFSKWRHGGDSGGRKRAQAASDQQPGLIPQRIHSWKRRRQTDDIDTGSVGRARPQQRVEGQTADDDRKEGEGAEQQSESQQQLRLFLQSSPSDLPGPHCAVRQPGTVSCCVSLSLPPFRRWLRWLVLVSFITPMPVEKCYAHVLAYYVPLHPLDQLLSDAFTVAVVSVRDRRRRGLCPVLSVDLPPLMEAMLSAALLASPSSPARPHWLLQCLLSLLSPADSTASSPPQQLVLSIADVLRTLPGSSAALLPPSSPPPAAPYLLRLLSAVQTDAFMVAWLLRAAASYSQRAAASHHRSQLVAFFSRHFGLLRWEQHEAAIRCTLGDEQLLFLHELQRPQQQQEAVAGSVASVEEREALAVQAALLPSADGEDELQDGDTAVAEVEVDWSTACDDDANGALLSRTEREKKAGRRGQQPQQHADVRLLPFSNQDDAQDEQQQRGSVQAAATVTCDAQTQTSPWPAPPHSPELTAADPPDLVAMLLPSYDSRLSASPSLVPSLSAAAGLPPSDDPFELPGAVDELTGFVWTDEPAAASPPDAAAALQSVDSSASAAAALRSSRVAPSSLSAASCSTPRPRFLHQPCAPVHIRPQAALSPLCSRHLHAHAALASAAQLAGCAQHSAASCPSSAALFPFQHWLACQCLLRRLRLKFAVPASAL